MALQRSPTTPSHAVFLGIDVVLRAIIEGPSTRLATLRLILLTFAQVEVSLFSSPSSQPHLILPHHWCKEAILSPRRLRLYQNESKKILGRKMPLETCIPETWYSLFGTDSLTAV
ncbi:hypothetical protein ARMGADRAFT_287373 [Armillaria gallica]|uniref:Uncharacterized protein n=1 Tax=Armillaria gallica TaxID=47427 RepID=A0A2H3DAI8_ARMGA|nr:hypothetical protein ARMGADRAFT_287373 [Armillaria gallica]